MNNPHPIELAAVATLALGQLLIQLLALVLALAGYKPTSKAHKAPQPAPAPIKATTTRKPRRARSRASLALKVA
jgi:hypothetical protein